jgi:flagellar FliL protein
LLNPAVQHLTLRSSLTIMSEPTAPAAPAAPAKKSKKPLVLILGGVLVLGLLGGGAFWYIRRAPAGQAAHVKPPERGILAFEPFVVNLADPSGSRFLRTTVQLIVTSELEAEHVKKTPVVMMEARGAILELLAVQTSEALVTPGGKTKLKKAIAEAVGAALEHVKVVDVLFSDFVVQF